MKSLILLVFITFFPLLLLAQGNGIVRGKIMDTTAHQPLSGATISVIYLRDSSIASYTLADKKGFFEIKNLKADNYLLTISFTGYENYRIIFSISNENRNYQVGEVAMQKEYKMLEGVTVADPAPVKINGDTISFKTDAFNSRPDATVEEVLKKIPGIQVQKDGTINVMGERVQKIYVDGKEFFGNDPQLATKNLTADMVDQIQVFDDMSEQSKFTRIDDGSRIKTINIKLKKDKKKGDFGRFTAGGGTDSRYEANGSFNHFRGNRRVSLVGSGNNTNKQEYTFNDITSQNNLSSFSQGSGGGMAGTSTMSAVTGAGSGGSTGVSTPRSGGVNFNDQWGVKMDFRGSYHYSQSDYLLLQEGFKKYSFPGDSTSEMFTTGENRSRNKNHRVNARWEYRIDSLNSVLYTANLQTQQSRILYSDTSFTMSKAAAEFLAVTGKTGRHDERIGLNYGGELLYRKRFRIPGRTFTLGWRNGYNESETDNRIHTPITTYNAAGSMVNFINLNQENNQDLKGQNNHLSASYTEPVGSNKLLEFNLAWSGNKNVSDKKAFDFNNTSGKYDLVNLLQTNYFEYTNHSARVGSNFRVVKKNFNYQLGMSVQRSELKNRSVRAFSGQDTTITQRFTNLFPTAGFSYNLSRTKSIRINYRGRTNAPNVNQLQDVPDFSNPLQIKYGNPSLKQEFISNLNLNYSAYSIKTYRFFSTSLTLNSTANKIVNSVDSSGNFVLITRPENLNGAYSGSGMISVGFPIRKIEGAQVNFSTMTYHSRDVTRFYQQNYFNTIWVISPSIGVGFSKGNLDLGIAGSLAYNRIRFELQESSNTEYIRQAWSADISYRFENDFFLLSDFDYYINSGRSAGFNEDIFLWNMAVAKKFLKNKTAEIKLTAYDLLRQNKGINRTTGENYFEDTRSNVVPGFFLLSMTYTLRQKVSPKPETTRPVEKL